MAKPWSGIGYRVANPQRANATDLLAGIAARIAGGRWNPIGAFSVVYLSCEHQTATEEALAGNLRKGLPPWKATPFVLTAVDVRLTPVLDVTEGRVRRTLLVSLARMIGEPWWAIQDRGEEAITQAIGRLARGAGFQGLVASSSAVRGGTNLVIFPDNLKPGDHRLEIVNADQLPLPPPGP